LGSEVLVPDTVPKYQRDCLTSSIGQSHLPPKARRDLASLGQKIARILIWRVMPVTWPHSGSLCQLQVLGNSLKLVLRLFLLSCLKVRILSQGNHNLEF